MRRGRWAFGLTTLAVLYGLAILPAAFLLPVYSTSSAGPGVTHGSATLIAENGAGVGLLIALAAPAALAALTWFGLYRTCRYGGVWGTRVAGTAVIVLGLMTFLTGFTIGPALLPCLALLVMGMGLMPSPSPAA